MANQMSHKPIKSQQTRYESEQVARASDPPLPDWETISNAGDVGVLIDGKGEWRELKDDDIIKRKANAMDIVIELVNAWDKSKSKFVSESEALINAIKIIVESLDTPIRK